MSDNEDERVSTFALALKAYSFWSIRYHGLALNLTSSQGYQDRPAASLCTRHGVCFYRIGKSLLQAASVGTVLSAQISCPTLKQILTRVIVAMNFRTASTHSYISTTSPPRCVLDGFSRIVGESCDKRTMTRSDRAAFILFEEEKQKQTNDYSTVSLPHPSSSHCICTSLHCNASTPVLFTEARVKRRVLMVIEINNWARLDSASTYV
ncbi:hypothetical protein BDR03DRAFT_983039 [Suillus americanus]|nr:hypothetical protein BDR03DRAFT_983039 [Suillus americanus]